MLRALLGKAPRATGAWLESVTSLAAEAFPPRSTRSDNDASAALYRAAPLTLAATALLGLMLSMALDLASTSRISSTWLAAMLAVTGARLLHAMYWRQANLPPDASALTRRYLGGVALNALLWGALPWLTFAGLSLGARISVMLATIAVASAEARPLSQRLPRSAALQALLLVVPGCLWLFDSNEGANTAVCAMMGVLLAALGSSIRIAHVNWRNAAAAADENHRLAGVEQEQRRQIERLMKESAEARNLMERAQLGLEQRIDERTAALEGRSRELAQQAVTDSLTKLPNRKGINDHLTELLAPMHDKDSGGELALLFLDLDDFKEVNDQFGHLAGDQVLCVVSDRLRETLPRIGFAARWGGDEFIVVLPGMGRRVEQVRIIAEQVRAALCLPIRLDKGVVRIGCSIGIAIAPEHGRTPEALVISADHAVYAAKSGGNDRVRVFDIALAKKAGRQHQIAQGLPAALDLGQIEVAYQPIVSAETGSATHVESLARWTHPKWGAVSPGEFIPVAEASGHIHTLGRWVLRQACLDAARWPGAHPPKVSVNVSALQVSSGRLVAQVREALSAAKLPASRLVIELTESLPMAGGGGVSKTLADLREMGVTLAIDDFGTGYSSLSALMKQPLSLVKVDRSFVQDVPGEGELLIKATVDVARCFGLDVVAEGVETPAQRARLIALGVGYMQGYLFGRPMPNAEFVAWLGLRDTTEEPFALLQA
ncbi:MAG TPA: EAL domain-containing protein [Burkholderiaceae bacterium]